MRIPAKLLRGKLTPRKLAAILLIWLAGVAISHFAGTADFGTRPIELAPIPESAEGKAGGKIRVCSWNVHNYCVANRPINGKWREHPKPEAEKAALRKTLSAINADVVLLQEMGDEAYLAELRDALAREGLAYPYCAITSFDAHARVAIMSRIKPEKFHDCSDISFEFKGEKTFSPRGTIGAEFKTAGKSWHAFSIHLKSKSGARKADEQFYPFRFAEARTIDARIFSITGGGPTVIAGDFNNEPSPALMRNFKKLGARMLGGGDFASAGAYTYYWKKKGIAYVYDYFAVNAPMEKFAGGPKIINFPAAREASDHLPIVADFDFSKGAGAPKR